MKLEQLSERIWYYPYEEERDRPNLGYIRGDRWSLAVDAGHSDDHVEAFYQALDRQGLPLPSLTVLTHWHWDHTFGLHRIHGLSLASERTNFHLKAFRERVAAEGPEAFLSLHESVRKEYAGGKRIQINTADLLFRGEMTLDAGSCPIRVFQAEAPHTDDSTLIYLPDEKMIFVGDAAGGTFPTWEKDGRLAEKLARTLRDTGAEICLEGHWHPTTLEDTVADLLE